MEETLGRLAALPGVGAVGLANYLPLSGAQSGSGFVVEEFPLGPGKVPPVFMEMNARRLFAALGIPLLEGRTFEPDDYRERLGNILISRSVAGRYWPKGGALGKRMTSWAPQAERPAGLVHGGRGGGRRAPGGPRPAAGGPGLRAALATS